MSNLVLFLQFSQRTSDNVDFSCHRQLSPSQEVTLVIWGFTFLHEGLLRVMKLKLQECAELVGFSRKSQHCKLWRKLNLCNLFVLCFRLVAKGLFSH